MRVGVTVATRKNTQYWELFGVETKMVNIVSAVLAASEDGDTGDEASA